MERKTDGTRTVTIVPAEHTKIIDFNQFATQLNLDDEQRQAHWAELEELADKLPNVELDLSDPDNPKVLFHGQIDLTPPAEP